MQDCIGVLGPWLRQKWASRSEKRIVFRQTVDARILNQVDYRVVLSATSRLESFHDSIILRLPRSNVEPALLSQDLEATAAHN